MDTLNRISQICSYCFQKNLIEYTYYDYRFGYYLVFFLIHLVSFGYCTTTIICSGTCSNLNYTNVVVSCDLGVDCNFVNVTFKNSQLVCNNTGSKAIVHGIGASSSCIVFNTKFENSNASCNNYGGSSDSNGMGGNAYCKFEENFFKNSIISCYNVAGSNKYGMGGEGFCEFKNSSFSSSNIHCNSIVSINNNMGMSASGQAYCQFNYPLFSKTILNISGPSDFIGNVIISSTFDIMGSSQFIGNLTTNSPLYIYAPTTINGSLITNSSIFFNQNGNLTITECLFDTSKNISLSLTETELLKLAGVSRTLITQSSTCSNPINTLQVQLIVPKSCNNISATSDGNNNGQLKELFSVDSSSCQTNNSWKIIVGATIGGFALLIIITGVILMINPKTRLWIRERKLC